MRVRSIVMTVLMMALGLQVCRAANQNAARPHTVAVQVAVISHDGAMAKRLTHALRAALAARHYSRRKPWPDVRIYVYAMRDVGNTKNPHGWSIAVAYAAVSPLLMAVPPLLKSKHHLAGLLPGPRLATVFMHSAGILTYLNVINVERMDEHGFTLVVRAIMRTFTARWPLGTARHDVPKSKPQSAARVAKSSLNTHSGVQR